MFLPKCGMIRMWTSDEEYKNINSQARKLSSMLTCTVVYPWCCLRVREQEIDEYLRVKNV
jgi:hypothetical protein